MREFLSRVSTLTCDIDTANLSVCPSVRLFVRPSVRNVPVLDENGLTYCQKVIASKSLAGLKKLDFHLCNNGIYISFELLSRLSSCNNFLYYYYGRFQVQVQDDKN